MKSAYPSFHSFFDATSDARRADDPRCRSSASFSSLADLFTNRSCKSDLFPNVRAPVFTSEEVRFPAKKKRECEERTSIWHEWGSGECQSEHVAQESYGFSSEHLVGNSSALSGSSFPNLGSANISVVAEGFTFPERKEREEGSSWREERTWGKDWSTTTVPRESKVPEGSPIVGPITDMYLSQPSTKPSGFVGGSKCGPFSSLGGTAKSASEEVSFPARKKREERSFWQEASLDGLQPERKVIATTRASTSGSGSLQDMFSGKTAGRRSNLFSNGSGGNPEEVVFPKRKDRANRDAWRDWSNTEYGDDEDDTDDGDYWFVNSSTPNSDFGSEVDDFFDLPSSTGTPSIEGSNRLPVRLSETKDLPAWECGLRTSAHEIGTDLAASMQEPLEAIEGQGAGPSDSVVGIVDESFCPEPCLGPQADKSVQAVATRGERTLDGAASCDAMENIRTEVDDVQESRFPESMSEQSARNFCKYRPPRRSTPRQGSSGLPNHMPWVQLRPFRSGGRFVLQEVKTTQPVVFQPIRKAGRLVLELIGQEKKKRGDAGPTFDRDSPVADEKATGVSEEETNMDLDSSVTVKTDVKEKVEKTGTRQHEDAAPGVMEGQKKTITVWPASGALAAKERGKSSTVWPISCSPPDLLPGEEVIFTRTEEAASGMWDRKLREVCSMAEEIIQSPDRRVSEQEDSVTAVEEAVVQDRPPAWLLGKVSTEDRRFDASRRLHSASNTRNAAEPLGQTGSVVNIHSVRETTPLLFNYQTLSRTSSLRNGLSGFNCPRAEGEGTLTRSRSVRSASLSDVASIDAGKEEAPGRAADARMSVNQGIIWDSVLSLASNHFLRRSPKARPHIPGELDPRFSNYKPTVAAALAFSCAEGMGKRHHEKLFWERQPCVSIST